MRAAPIKVFGEPTEVLELPTQPVITVRAPSPFLVSRLWYPPPFSRRGFSWYRYNHLLRRPDAA